MIEVRSLSKRYGPTLAVDELSFAVRPGVVTGFVGPNGAGKSTSLRMILGLDHPTSGVAQVNGRPYAETRNPMREVGALLDAKSVHGGRTARKHLRALARSNGLARERVEQVLELTGLSPVAGRRPGARRRRRARPRAGARPRGGPAGAGRAAGRGRAPGRAGRRRAAGDR